MKEVLQQAIDFAEYCLEELDLSYMASNQAKRLVEKSKEALAKQEQGEPVAWRIRWTDGSVSYREEKPSDACQSECEVKALYVKE